MNKQILKNYNKLSSYKPALSFHRIPRDLKYESSASYKSALSFHKIPYHLQYETRDFNTKAKEPSIKTLMNREKYIKSFNPYLRSNVSENLDQKLVDFYRYKYSNR
tara:strand:- start:225 stop:542 length:318 start_codon:yes stop_codon:yes gene_type:complete